MCPSHALANVFHSCNELGIPTQLANGGIGGGRVTGQP